MKRVLVFLLLILSLSLLYAQEVQEEWVSSYDLQNPVDLELDNDNNVYILSFYCTIIKYDNSGNELWSVTHDYSSDGGITLDLGIDQDNNIYITGYKNGVTTYSDIFTLKYDSTGTLLWETTYQGLPWSENSRPAGLALDNYGNVYICGNTRYSTENSGLSQGVLIKYSPEGCQDWVSYYEPVNDNWFETRAVTVNDSGEIIVTGGDGIKFGSGCALLSTVTMKFNSDGALLWDYIFSEYPNGSSQGSYITVDADNNIYSIGDAWSPVGHQIITLKYNNLGELLWDAHYTPEGIPILPKNPAGVAVDNENNVIVASKSDMEGMTDLVKYNQFGELLWEIDTIAMNGIGVDENNNIYLTGRLLGDYATIMYNPNGIEEWTVLYNGADELGDESKNIIIDNSGNIYISGVSYMHDNMYNCTTVKYSQISYSPEDQISTQIYSLSNYPNPFNPTTEISFSLASSSTENTVIEIYNVKGQRVKTISVSLSGIEGRQTQTVIWDGTDQNNNPVASGVYFLNLKIGSELRAVKKCLLLK